MDDKKILTSTSAGAEIKTLEHHHAPVPGAGAENGVEAEAPRQLSLRTLFTNRDMTAFYQEALDKYGYDGAITAEQEKRLVRKIDCLILPW